MASLPLATFAAFDDVTLDSSAVLSVGGATLNISSNSYMPTITVSGSSFTVTLNQGSSLEVSVAEFNQLSTASVSGTYRETNVCKSGASLLSLLPDSDGTSATITVTVSSSICGSSGSSSGGSSSATNAGGNGPIVSSGGGGGGGGSYSAPVTATGASAVTTSNTTVGPVVAQSVPVTAPKLHGMITKLLKRGMTSAEVLTLQQILNMDADTMITASGAGSPGRETKLFGLLTEKAVQKFQKKYGIISSGSPATTGFGIVGPKTRAKLNSI